MTGGPRRLLAGRLAAGWLLIAWQLAGCRPLPAPPDVTATPPPAILQLGLATAAAPLAELVTAPYGQQTDRAVLQFVPANGAALFADLANGQLDAILVHHIPAGTDIWFSPVAVDGLALVAPAAGDAPLSLTRAEIQAVFSGRITTWDAVGGAASPITPIIRERGAGVRTLFNSRVMAEQRVSINALVAAGDGALLAAVAGAPGAIGTSMMGSAGGQEDLRLLAVDGIPATPAETASQRYPLTVPLYFVSPAEPTGELRAFLAWLQSDAGQALLGARYGRVR